MKQKNNSRLKRGIVNTFGAFGYLFGCLLWFWVVILYFRVIQPVIIMLAPPAREQQQPTPDFIFTPPSLFEIIIMAVVVVVMIALTMYVLVKMPLMIAKAGRTAVHKTTEKVVPLAIKVRHKKDTKKLRTLLTIRAVLIIKVLLVVLPALLTVGVGLLEALNIEYAVAVIIGGGLAGLSAVCFAIQYSLAGSLRVKMSDLW